MPQIPSTGELCFTPSVLDDLFSTFGQTGSFLRRAAQIASTQEKALPEQALARLKWRCAHASRSPGNPSRWDDVHSHVAVLVGSGNLPARQVMEAWARLDAEKIHASAAGSDLIRSGCVWALVLQASAFLDGMDLTQGVDPVWLAGLVPRAPDQTAQQHQEVCRRLLVQGAVRLYLYDCDRVEPERLELVANLHPAGCRPWVVYGFEQRPSREARGKLAGACWAECPKPFIRLLRALPAVCVAVGLLLLGWRGPGCESRPAILGKGRATEALPAGMTGEPSVASAGRDGAGNAKLPSARPSARSDEPAFDRIVPNGSVRSRGRRPRLRTSSTDSAIARPAAADGGVLSEPNSGPSIVLPPEEPPFNLPPE